MGLFDAIGGAAKWFPIYSASKAGYYGGMAWDARSRGDYDAYREYAADCEINTAKSIPPFGTGVSIAEYMYDLGNQPGDRTFHDWVRDTMFGDRGGVCGRPNDGAGGAANDDRTGGQGGAVNDRPSDGAGGAGNDSESSGGEDPGYSSDPDEFRDQFYGNDGGGGDTPYDDMY